MIFYWLLIFVTLALVFLALSIWIEYKESDYPEYDIVDALLIAATWVSRGLGLAFGVMSVIGLVKIMIWFIGL